MTKIIAYRLYQGDPVLLKAKDFNLNSRVLWALANRLKFGNIVYATHADLAKDVDDHRQHVSRSMRRLMALGVVAKGDKSGRYLLNPATFWKGSDKGRTQAMAIWFRRQERARLTVIDGGKS